MPASGQCATGRACCAVCDVASKTCVNGRLVDKSTPYRRLGRLPMARAPTRKRWCTIVRVAKGFGKSRGKRAKKGSVNTKQSKPMKLDAAEGWVAMGTMSGFKEGKDVQTVMPESGLAFVLYRVGDTVYCSDSSSTAFQFPLSDAKILEGREGPAIETPLDGTTYDLKTGKVLAWCPRNNPLRSFLGALKSKAEPVDLGVYDVMVSEDGQIFAKIRGN